MECCVNKIFFSERIRNNTGRLQNIRKYEYACYMLINVFNILLIEIFKKSFRLR